MEHLYNIGQTVKVTSGHFAGYIGKISEMNFNVKNEPCYSLEGVELYAYYDSNVTQYNNVIELTDEVATEVFCVHCNKKITTQFLKVFLEEPYCSVECVSQEVKEHLTTHTDTPTYIADINGDSE